MPTPRPIPPSQIQPMPTTVGIPEGHGSAEVRAKPRPLYPSPMNPSTRGVPTPTREVTATITGPNGWPFRYHASYTVGIGKCESGSLALTRRGIERKARRVIRRLERRQRIHDACWTMRAHLPGEPDEEY